MSKYLPHQKCCANCEKKNDDCSKLKFRAMKIVGSVMFGSVDEIYVDCTYKVEITGG